ncbi:hypothetical protein I7I48_09984 [Histoplasma ohiense]|nr:hypothetical protein I7I48_09984 [Histoplasma ohiense (nom. inval.)]
MELIFEPADINDIARNRDGIVRFPRRVHSPILRNNYHCNSLERKRKTKRKEKKRKFNKGIMLIVKPNPASPVPPPSHWYL